MDRLECMAIFARVAETQSFTGAAKSLGMPKASVSSGVARLEERLGTRLLQRTTRRVQLTPDGQLFYERCKDLLADAEDVETLFQSSNAGIRGRVRVDMPTRLAHCTIIPQVGEFLAAYPGIELELGASDRNVDLVREGYDCVVRVGSLADSGLVARRIGEIQLANYASPSYLKIHGHPRRLHDLERHFLVHYSTTLGGKPDRFEYEDHGESKELPMRGRITVNNAEAYLAACLGGLGVIQAPRYTMDGYLHGGRLVELLPKYRARPMPITLLFPHRRQLPRRVRVFADWLEQKLGFPDPTP